MSKAPAFQFYFDRFNSSTALWDDCQVGKYIRLMICQANKGYVSAKELNKVGADDYDVLSKFVEIAPGQFANEVLTGILSDRDAYRESRQKNRLSGLKKKENQTHEQHMSNICESHDEHMVDVDVVVDKVKEVKKEKGGVGEKFNPFDFIPDTWDRTEFMECWTAHMDVRRKKKNPATPKACEMMLKELVRVCPVWSDARSKMEAAIISGWPKYIYDGPTTKKSEPEGGRYAHERVTIFDKA